jgi:hypothetical protein
MHRVSGRASPSSASALPRSAGYHARRILAFRERYQTGDVIAAMAHAQQYGAFEYHAIERILAVRAAPRRLDEYVAEATEKKLAAIVRQSRTEPRELAMYAPRRARAPCPCRSIHTTHLIHNQDPNGWVTPDQGSRRIRIQRPDNRIGSDPPPRLDPLLAGTYGIRCCFGIDEDRPRRLRQRR